MQAGCAWHSGVLFVTHPIRQQHYPSQRNLEIQHHNLIKCSMSLIAMIPNGHAAAAVWLKCASASISTLIVLYNATTCTHVKSGL